MAPDKLYSTTLAADFSQRLFNRTTSFGGLGTPSLYMRDKLQASNISIPATELTFYEFPEHFFRIDGDECAFAAGQHFTFLVQDFSGVDVLTAVNTDFPALYVQRLV